MAVCEESSDPKVLKLENSQLDVKFALEHVDVIDAYLEEGRTCVIDLSEVRSVDSAGYGLLVRWRQRAVRQGARMILCSPSQETLEGLRLTCLDQVFEVYANMEKALESAAEPSA